MKSSSRLLIWIVPLVLVVGLLIARPQGMPSWLPVFITVFAGLVGAWFVVSGVWSCVSGREHRESAAGAILAGVGFFAVGVQNVASAGRGWLLATLAGALVVVGLALQSRHSAPARD